MELGLLLFVAFGLYLWARAHAKRAEERRALRWFTYTERIHGTNDPRLDWDVDFVDMQLNAYSDVIRSAFRRHSISVPMVKSGYMGDRPADSHR